MARGAFGVKPLRLKSDRSERKNGGKEGALKGSAPLSQATVPMNPLRAEPTKVIDQSNENERCNCIHVCIHDLLHYTCTKEEWRTRGLPNKKFIM